jgi:hypothetical protein
VENSINDGEKRHGNCEAHDVLVWIADEREDDVEGAPGSQGAYDGVTPPAHLADALLDRLDTAESDKEKEQDDQAGEGRDQRHAKEQPPANGGETGQLQDDEAGDNEDEEEVHGAP